MKKAQHSVILMAKLSHPRAGKKRRAWPTPAPPQKVDAHTSIGGDGASECDTNPGV